MKKKPTIKLRPCPICGQQPKVFFMGYEWRVTCSTFPLTTHFKTYHELIAWGRPKSLAVRRWNRGEHWVKPTAEPPAPG